MTANNAHDLGAAIEAEMTDDHWLALAAAVPDDDRARHLANPEPTRSTTVDPVLAAAIERMHDRLNQLKAVRDLIDYELSPDAYRALLHAVSAVEATALDLCATAATMGKR